MPNFINVGGLVYVEASTIVKIEGFEAELKIVITLKDGSVFTKFASQERLEAMVKLRNAKRGKDTATVAQAFHGELIRFVDDVRGIRPWPGERYSK